MRRRTTTLLSTLTIAVALFASACSGGSEDQPSSDERKPAADAATLDSSWDASGNQPAWFVDDTVIIKGDQTVTAVGLEDGTERWSTTMPDSLSICATSPEVNDDGLAGLLLGVEGGGEYGDLCETAAAIDTSTGEVKWTKEFDNPTDSSTFTDGVSVGDDALVAVSCVTARFSLDDGAELEPLFEMDEEYVDDRECSNHQAVTAEGIVITKAPGKDRSVDLAAYDGDTGEELWRRPTDRPDQPYEIVSLEPLVLDILEEGVSAIRKVDDEGKLGAELGRQYEGYSGGRLGIAKVLDDNLAVAELGPGERSLTVYDMSTGDEVGSRVLGKDERLVALDDGGVLTERPSVDDPFSSSELLYSELTDLDQVSSLGTAEWKPGLRSYDVAGDLLIASAPGHVKAVPILDEDERKPVDAAAPPAGS